QRAVCGRMFDMMRGLKPDIQIPGGVPAACIPHANGLHALAKCFLRARIDATFGAILLPRLENWSRGRALSMDVFQVGGAKCNMFRVFALRRCDGRRNGRRGVSVGFGADRRALAFSAFSGFLCGCGCAWEASVLLGALPRAKSCRIPDGPKNARISTPRARPQSYILEMRSFAVAVVSLPSLS